MKAQVMRSLATVLLVTSAAAADGPRFIRHWGSMPYIYHGPATYCVAGGGELLPGEMVSASTNDTVLIARYSSDPNPSSGLQLRGWGSNDSGVFAWPPTSLPEEVCLAAPGNFPPVSQSGLYQVALSINGYHAAAIVDSICGWGFMHRSVTCWGSNLYGECNAPCLYQIYQVTCGLNFTVARKHNGYVVAWGRNDYGQSSPPGGLDGVVDIAAGGFHSLALRSSGTVVGWGAGSGAYDGVYHCDQARPPEGLDSVVDVAAGGWHSMALLADGTVVCWGAGASPPNYNFHYQQSQPPADLGPCRLIATGWYSSVAVTVDGEIRRWGYSGWGWPGGNCTGQCDVIEGAGQLEEVFCGYRTTIGISDLDRPECPFDIEPNCSVDGGDLAVLIADWGKARSGTSSDLDQSGAVDAVDLAMMLSNWGSCPQ